MSSSGRSTVSTLLGYAEQGTTDSSTVVYFSGSAISTSATRSSVLALPIVIPTGGMVLEAVIALSGSASALQIFAGIWDDQTELERIVHVTTAASTAIPFVMDYYLPPGDGVTVHDFHIRFGVRDTTPGTANLFAVGANNQRSRLLARAA